MVQQLRHCSGTVHNSYQRPWVSAGVLFLSPASCYVAAQVVESLSSTWEIQTKFPATGFELGCCVQYGSGPANGRFLSVSLSNKTKFLKEQYGKKKKKVQKKKERKKRTIWSTQVPTWSMNSRSRMRLAYVRERHVNIKD